MQDVVLTWRGEEFTIEARNVLRLIAKIEEIITLPELFTSAEHNSVPLAKVSMAFGAALRHAGARVTDDEVYSGMFEAGTKEAAFTAVNTLLTLMIPPEHLQEKGDGKKKAKAQERGGSSSRKRIKPQSPGDSSPKNSGG